MGLRVAEQADVSHLRRRYQGDHGVHHAQTGAQNGNDRQLFARKDLDLGRCDGGLDLDLLGGKIARGLIAHQRGDLAHGLAELLDARVLVTQDGQLMLQKGML